MKKLFISALAIASLVACSKDELVSQQSPAAIGFAGAFVENATRSTDPSTKTADLTAFKVWAFMDETDGTVFEDQNVTKNEDGAWTYSPLQYWTPGHTYYFGALAPMNNKNWDLNTENANKLGAGVVSFTNVDGTEDLLYAATSVTTNDDINKQPEKVDLIFNHLLSKVKFSFTNGFPADNYWITVSNIQMTAPAAGTIDLAVENWWDNNDWQLPTQDEVTLEFGNMEKGKKVGNNEEDPTESDFERLTIPASADQEYVVTFDVELFVGNDADKAVSALKNTLTTTITGAALEMGKAYNFHAVLNAGNIAGGDGDEEDKTLLTPIVFEVQQVKDWVVDNGYDGGKIETEFQSANVSTAAELLNAVEAGANEIKLLADIDLGDESLVFDAPATSSFSTRGNVAAYTLDLNGKAIAATGDAIIVDGGVSLTINGDGAVVAGQDASGNAVWVKYGDVVINGGTYSVGADDDDRNDCIYVGAAAYVADAATKVSSVSIYGGNFSAEVLQSNQYWVLNLRDEFAKAGSSIKVYGGTFTNFNPGNNLSEGKGTNFVAAGYISLPQADGSYEVVELAGEIKLEGNVELAAPISVSKNVVVNLNGKTISIDRAEGKQDYVFLVLAGGDLTINGEGKVAAGEAATSVAVWAYGGNVTINGGTYTNAGEGCDLIYADKGSVVTINGGTFQAVERKDGVDGTAERYSALNCRDNSGSSFVVKGGSYYRFNPGNNKSENPAVSFVADGYEAYVIDADWYGVKAQ